MPSTNLNDRTRLRSDPVRNFKYQVQMFHSNSQLTSQIGEMGFMTVEGLAMNTEMVPYREGGWNTNPHKLPGQTDFAPLTLAAGVFYKKPGMWNLAKQMFSVQWGEGTIGMGQEYRYDMAVRIMDHPVTSNPGSGSSGDGINGAVMAFAFYNCWTASIGFNGLNAMDNAVLVHQMQVHHEGFDVFFDNADAMNLTHSGSSVGGTIGSALTAR
jgi:phage tail-like protein